MPFDINKYRKPVVNSGFDITKYTKQSAGQQLNPQELIGDYAKQLQAGPISTDPRPFSEFAQFVRGNPTTQGTVENIIRSGGAVLPSIPAFVEQLVTNPIETVTGGAKQMYDFANRTSKTIRGDPREQWEAIKQEPFGELMNAAMLTGGVMGAKSLVGKMRGKPATSIAETVVPKPEPMVEPSPVAPFDPTKYIKTDEAVSIAEQKLPDAIPISSDANLTNITPPPILAAAEATQPQVPEIIAKAVRKTKGKLEKVIPLNNRGDFATMRDVTPGGYGLSETPIEDLSPQFRDSKLITEWDKLQSSLNEGKTILKGKMTPEKRLAVEKSVASTEAKIAELESKMPPKPISASDIDRPYTVRKSRKPTATTESLSQKKPYEMTGEELSVESDRLAQTEKMSEKDILGDDWGRWNKAQRQQNSHDNVVANAAAKTIDEIESRLSKSQVDRLYGIGESGNTAEILSAFREEVNSIDPSSPEALGKSIGKAMTDVGQKTDPATMTMTEQMAYTKIKEGLRVAQQEGFDPKVVFENGLRSAAKRFSDPADAEFMLSRYLSPEKTQPSKIVVGQTDPALKAIGKKQATIDAGKAKQAVGRVRVAGAEFDLMSSNPDEVLTVRNSQGAVFDYPKGTPYTIVDVGKKPEFVHPSQVPLSQYLERNQLERKTLFENSLSEATQELLSAFPDKEKLPVGISRLQSILTKTPRGKVQRSAMARYNNAVNAIEIKGRDALSDKILDQQVHRSLVEKTLQEGKPVPASVLADYPDLAAKGKAIEKGKAEGVVPPIIANAAKGKGTTPKIIEKAIGKKNNAIGVDNLTPSAITPEPIVGSAESVSGIKGSIGDTEVGRIANDYAKALDQPLKDFHTKVAQAIIDKDPEFIKQLVAHGRGFNDISKKFFEKETGIKLPSTVEGKTQAVYDWAGKEVPPKAAKPEPPPKMSKQEAWTKAREAGKQVRIDRALDQSIRYDGVVTTKKTLMEQLRSKGAFSEAKQLTDNNALAKLVEHRRRLSGNGMQNINAEQIAEVTDKINQGVTKTSYRIHTKGDIYIEVSKTEYDYFNSLGTKTPPSPSVELGALGTPQVAIDTYNTVKSAMQEVSKQTKQVLDAAHTSYGTPEGRGFGTAIKTMWNHNKALRDVEFVSGTIKKTFDRLKLPEDRQAIITHALEQPEKYIGQLSPLEKGVYEWLKIERDKVQQYAIKTGLIKNENPNYMFHHWIDPKTGEPYNAMYGRLNKNAPQLKARTIPTYEVGIANEMTPASMNPADLIAKSMVSVTRAAEARIMLKRLARIKSDLPGEMLRSKSSTEAKPLRLLESWRKLEDQELTDGYTRWDHPTLDKPITFQDANGNLHSIQGSVGIQKDLAPFVKDYFDNPSYGNFARLNFATKSLKLMGGFHIFSLNFQGLVGGIGKSRIPVYNVIDGLSKIAEGGETLRRLYRNGLKLKGYTDVGEQGNALDWFKKIPTVGKPIAGGLEAIQHFTFDVVHPGIKTSTAFSVFDDISSRMESKLGRALNEAEKETVAKETVNWVNRLYSGEDYRSALLQTNQWMAKHWYDPKARAKWQAALISPSWQKEHVGIAADIGGSIIRGFQKGKSRPTDYLARRYAANAVGLYVAANLYNWTMTKYMDGEGKFMWQNDGHNVFSVRAPWSDPDGRKAYFRPLKSIFEIPELMTDPVGKSLGKLSPIVSASAKQIAPDQSKDYTGWHGIPNRAVDFSQDVGMPISGTTLGDQSKGVLPKAFSVLGIPTSKGLSNNKLKQMIQEAAFKGDTATVKELSGQLSKQLKSGMVYNMAQSQKRAEQRRNKLLDLMNQE